MLHRSGRWNRTSKVAPTIGRLSLCAASIFLAIGLFEAPGLLGLVDYRTLFQARLAPWERPGNRPDAELLYVREGKRRLRPVLSGNDVARLSGGPAATLYQCDVQYDRDGFRNPCDLDQADVVVLGDSLVEGFHIDEDEIVTARLSRRLALTVANLARGGDGPQQELQILKRYGLRLQPKACVWAFYEGNDLADAAEFEMNQQRVKAWELRPWWRHVFDGLFAANCLDYVCRTMIHPEPRVPARLFTGRFAVRPGESVEMAFGSGDHRIESPREASPDLERVVDAVAEARAICREREIAFLVVFIPSKFRVYRDFCDFERDSPCRNWTLDDLPTAMKEAVGRLGADVAFIDLTRRFRDEAAAGSLLYLPDDTHWSSVGHRVAAEELAAGLAELRP